MYLLGDYDPDQKIKENYRIEKEIGRGSYGVVYSAFDRSNGEQYAIKSISKIKFHGRDDHKLMRGEMHIMEALNGHPNVVSVIETYEDAWNVHFVLEFCDAGDLMHHIVRRKRLTEKDISRLMKQVKVHLT